MQGDTGRYREIRDLRCGSRARAACGEMQGDAGRCREMQGDAGRCSVMQGDAGRCREMQGDHRPVAARKSGRNSGRAKLEMQGGARRFKEITDLWPRGRAGGF